MTQTDQAGASPAPERSLSIARRIAKQLRLAAHRGSTGALRLVGKCLYTAKIAARIAFNAGLSLSALVALSTGYYFGIISLREPDSAQVLLAIGAMIGTMLVLAFSLALIPIQRTVETFTPAIARIYRNDRTTQGIVVLLAVLSVLTFVVGSLNLDPSQRRLGILSGLCIVAFTMDLMRWFARRIALLITPDQAVARLLSATLNHMSQWDRKLGRLAGFQLWVDADDTEESVDLATRRRLTEASLYILFPGVEAKTEHYISEFREIAVRTARNSQTHVASMTIKALVQVAIRHMDLRERNLLILPQQGAMFLVSKSDADRVLGRVYDALEHIVNAAADARAAATAEDVLRAYRDIAVRTAHLNFPSSSRRTAPITYLPIGYLKTSATKLIRSTNLDAGLAASQQMLFIGQSSPQEVPLDDVHRPLAEAMWELAIELLKSGAQNWALANTVLRDLMVLLAGIAARPDSNAPLLLKTMLAKFRELVPFAVASERSSGPLGTIGLGAPMSTVYSPAMPTSLAQIIEAAQALVASGPVEPWIDPYHRFHAVSEAVLHHIHGLCREVDLSGSSFRLWIIQLIDVIAGVYHRILDGAPRTQQDWAGELAKDLGRYFGALSFAFSKPAQMGYPDFENAADAIGVWALAFYNSGFPETAKRAAETIEGAIRSATRNETSRHPSILADLVRRLVYLMRVAEARRDTAFASQINQMIERTLAELEATTTGLRGQVEAEMSVSSPADFRHERTHLLFTELLSGS